MNKHNIFCVAIYIRMKLNDKDLKTSVYTVDFLLQKT